MTSRGRISKMCNNGPGCKIVNCKYVHHANELRPARPPPGFKPTPCKYVLEFMCPRRNTCWHEHKNYPAAPGTSNPNGQLYKWPEAKHEALIRAEESLDLEERMAEHRARMTSQGPISKMCNDAPGCKIRNCKFVHNANELRPASPPPGFEPKPCKYEYEFMCPRRNTCWNKHRDYLPAPGPSNPAGQPYQSQEAKHEAPVRAAESLDLEERMDAEWAWISKFLGEE